MPPIELPGSAAYIVKRLPFVGPIYKDAVTYRRLKAGVSQGGRNALLLEHGGVPIPPIRLRDMVRKGGILAEDFLIEGAQACEAVLDFAREHGVLIEPSTRVYEFGVGCGRIARHLLVQRSCRFWGSDVDEELISWCRQNLTLTDGEGGTPEFFLNAYQPPLGQADGSFDFIYSISVLTHMAADSQKAWLHELHRVLAPGGHLVLSILERTDSEAPTGVLVQERVDREFVRGWLGKGGAPAKYYTTYNTVAYMGDLFAEGLELLGHRHNAVRNTQTLLMFRKKPE
jgi:2-polyprenyl-3-methyl-5-hydroxy-6-metoxy-1,4-benzoquinol methylase